MLGAGREREGSVARGFAKCAGKNVVRKMSSVLPSQERGLNERKEGKQVKFWEDGLGWEAGPS